MTFFATRSDIYPVLKSAESKLSVEYVECGLFVDDSVTRLPSLSGLQSLGVSNTGDPNTDATYMVVPSGAKVAIRTVPQRRGGVKFALDQLMNPGSVVLRLGGEVRGSRSILAGSLASVHTDAGARKVSSVFAEVLAGSFTKVKAFWLGEEAFARWKDGWRLCFKATETTEFDLSV